MLNVAQMGCRRFKLSCVSSLTAQKMLREEFEMDNYPHGKCECNNQDCACYANPGPVAYSVIRNKKNILVCTCCVTSEDTHIVCVVKRSDSPELYFNYDFLGAMLLTKHVCEDDGVTN